MIVSIARLDFETRTVWVNGSPIDLTRKQCGLLWNIGREGGPVSTSKLAELEYADGGADDSCISARVWSLRQRLRGSSLEIVRMGNRGYALNMPIAWERGLHSHAVAAE